MSGFGVNLYTCGLDHGLGLVWWSLWHAPCECDIKCSLRQCICVPYVPLSTCWSLPVVLAYFCLRLQTTASVIQLLQYTAAVCHFFLPASMSVFIYWSWYVLSGSWNFVSVLSHMASMPSQNVIIFRLDLYYTVYDWKHARYCKYTNSILNVILCQVL